MSSRLLSAAVAVVALAAAVPAVAQQPQPAPQAAPQAAEPADEADAASPEEAAIEAAGEAFGARMEAMSQEMQAAATAAGADKDKAKADLDAIQARYQPDADAFAATLTEFIRGQVGVVPEDQRAGMQTALEQVGPTITGIPARVRAEVEQAAAAPAPEAVTPPATPPAS